jgi:hypothetical protein
MFLRLFHVFLCIVFLQSLYAQSFQKILRKPDNSIHYSRKLLRVNDTEFAFLTSTELYRIDQQGNILMQQNIGSNSYDLQDMALITNGQFVVAGGVYTGQEPAIRLTRLDAGGQVLREKEFNTNGSFSSIRLIPGYNNHVYLLFVHSEQQRRHVDVMYLDENFEFVWTRHHGFEVYNEMNAIAGSHGGVEYLHISPEDFAIHHFKLDADGNLAEQPVQYTGPQDALTIIKRMIKTPDGGYLYSGVQLTGTKNEDIVLLKTDDRGRTEWTKKHDLYLGDVDEGISVTDDGYMLLARTGNIAGALDQNNADIALVKLDLAGDTSWVRACGTAALDHSRSLLKNPDGSFIIGAQATTYYMILTEPVLLKTDAAGNFPDQTFPHPLQEPSPIVRAHADPVRPVQRLTNGALLPDGGMVMASSIIDPATDLLHPFISRADAQGNLLWHHPAPGNGVESILLKPMADGSFLSVTLVRNPLFVNDYYVTRFDADGKFDWSKKIYANYIKDAVMAPDGGYIFCGMEYEANGAVVRMLSVIKLNKQGDQVWKYNHRIDSKWIYGRSIQVTPENDILVAGFMQERQSSTSATYLTKLSALGKMKWYKTFSRGANLAVGNKVIITSTKDYLITGYVRYPGQLDKQDLLLLKTNPEGSLLWEKEYHIDKMDAGTTVIEYSGQYYIAGTTGQPEFGVKESFGLLFRTDVNGIQKGFSAFGNKGRILTCTDMYEDAQHKLHFMGTVQQPFGVERPFQAVLPTDQVLFTEDPVLDKTVQLYPIPASDMAYLLIDHPYIGDIRISITGISGVQLYNNKTQKTARVITVTLPVSGYVNGTYIVEVKIGKTSFLKKLVIGK